MSFFSDYYTKEALDQILRAVAIHAAAVAATPGVNFSTTEILNRAKAFEHFIKTGATK